MLSILSEIFRHKNIIFVNFRIPKKKIFSIQILREITLIHLLKFEFEVVENIVEKGENPYRHFLLFIRLSKTGRIMLSPVAGGVPHSLSGAYLQDYASYGYETSWVDRSHQGRVKCTGTITLDFELLPFVYFHT